MFAEFPALNTSISLKRSAVHTNPLLSRCCLFRLPRHSISLLTCCHISVLFCVFPFPFRLIFWLLDRDPAAVATSIMIYAKGLTDATPMSAERYVHWQLLCFLQTYAHLLPFYVLCLLVDMLTQPFYVF